MAGGGSGLPVAGKLKPDFRNLDFGPAQKAFDTALVLALQSFDPARPVFIEAESRRIGAITLPKHPDARAGKVAISFRPHTIRMIVGDGLRDGAYVWLNGAVEHREFLGEFTRYRVRPLTGLFGPRFQFGTSGPFRAFVTGKAGFIEWSTSGKAPSGTTFADSFGQFGGNSTMFAAYPGGGFETYLGPLGIRVEAGDEVYLNNGAHNNLRVTFGPSIRF